MQLISLDIKQDFRRVVGHRHYRQIDILIL